ncbi:hypothetical protein BC936DRAFT_139540 [Jimgerdemannia flammicorona]|uniref:Uncharacterized protein n=2 Tax=Jimgerdemannia flammicorona TaxID=994334 RepID=A0A433QIC0_9FUNG|nr:hypothetical protein BC936DRAFT_139540 [Jimgerdemannia flammicorona]RUS29570.1 hypothetical protein BC938DRAFT_480507 [Jimgerdemannia flammicorona]
MGKGPGHSKQLQPSSCSESYKHLHLKQSLATELEYSTSNIISDVANAQIFRMDENKREPTLPERRIMIYCVGYYKEHFAKWDDDLYYDVLSDDEKHETTDGYVKESPTAQAKNTIKALEGDVLYEDIRHTYGGTLALAFAAMIKTVRNSGKPMKNEDLKTLDRFGYFDEYPAIKESLEWEVSYKEEN